MSLKRKRQNKKGDENNGNETSITIDQKREQFPLSDPTLSLLVAGSAPPLPRLAIGHLASRCPYSANFWRYPYFSPCVDATRSKEWMQKKSQFGERSREFELWSSGKMLA